MKTAIALFCFFSLSQAQPPATAQQAATQNATTTATLSLSGPDGQHAAISAAELQAMPHQTVQVHNAHTSMTESYQGVELSLLLARIAAPLGSKLHGSALAMYVIAEGKDKYQAVYSLAEIDPAFHTGTVLIADHVNGQPIDEKDGPLKLVNTEDKRPARWVRNLVSLKLSAAQ